MYRTKSIHVYCKISDKRFLAGSAAGRKLFIPDKAPAFQKVSNPAPVLYGR
jgi:hypothetical protein